MATRIFDITDTLKDQMLRLRAVEAGEIPSNLTQFQTANNTILVETGAKAIQTDIGSGFYFHIEGHNLFSSPTSLLGDVRGGSVVLTT